MFDAIKFVYTPLALAAFIVAAVTLLMRHRQEKERRLIELAPEQQRGRLIERVLEGLNLAEEELTKAQRFRLAETLLRERANRFTITAFASLVIAIVIAAVVVVSMVQPRAASSPDGEHAKVIELETKVAQLGRENSDLQAKNDDLTHKRDELAHVADQREQDGEQLAEHVLTRDTVKALVTSVLKDHPDGLTDPDEAAASVICQLRAQDGFAEFLSGTKAHRLHVSYGSDGEVSFDWKTDDSTVPQLLEQAHVDAAAGKLVELNTALNHIGVAWMIGDASIVRTSDGGLGFVRPSQP